MHSHRPPGTPSRSKSSEAVTEISHVVQETADPAAEASPVRPFMERRRSRRIAQSWPEALDSLQRLLERYENANKELVEAETKYRTIFEDAPVGIFQVNPEGQVLSL